MTKPKTASQINAPQVGEIQMEDIRPWFTKRIEELERELAQAKARIAELESKP